MAVLIEFYGIPRARAGQASATIETNGDPLDLGSLLVELGRQFPALASECFEANRLKSGYAANLDGGRFISDPRTPLRDGASVLILSSDAGG
jgi:molybdopterin converting factor small subunit